jgi:hypothetical protein
MALMIEPNCENLINYFLQWKLFKIQYIPPLHKNLWNHFQEIPLIKGFLEILTSYPNNEKKMFNIQYLLQHKSKHYQTIMMHPCSLRALQWYQKHCWDLPNHNPHPPKVTTWNCLIAHHIYKSIYIPHGCPWTFSKMIAKTTTSFPSLTTSIL